MKNISKQIFFVFSLAVLLLGVAFAFWGGTKAGAVNPFDIAYPIAELGNCASQDECKNFCDAPENQKACVDWAEHSGLISTEDAMKIREMEEMRGVSDFRGPGGCESPEECDAYCKGPEHLEECLQFSVDEGFMSQEEANEIIEKANRGGPGGCQSREECDAFCREPENNRICMSFAIEEGEMTQEDADFMIEMMERHEEFDKRHGRPGGPEDPGPGEEIDEQKAMELIEELGGGPGGCLTFDECDNYCSQPGNDEECMNFAVEHELFPPEELEIMKKVMKEGGPGGCRGPEECDQFCSLEENQEECFSFAKKHGMIPPEEIEMMEKMMKRGGPGGCMGERECDDYCRQPDHAEECMNFSVEMGMMTQEEADRMLQFMKKMDERDRMRDMEMEMERERMDGDFRHDGPGGDYGEYRDGPYMDGEHGDMRGPGFFDGEMGPPQGFNPDGGEFYGGDKPPYYEGDKPTHYGEPYKDEPYRDGPYEGEPYWGEKPDDWSDKPHYNVGDRPEYPHDAGPYEPREYKYEEEDMNYMELYHEEPFQMMEPPKDESMFEAPVGMKQQSLLGTVLAPFLNLFR